MSILARISNKVILIINIVVVGLFLLACINPYLSPQDWPYFSLIALAFPFLLLFNLLFIIFWLFVHRKWALISVIALILGGSAITDFFAFNFFSSFKETKKTGTIRIATWNVARFIEMRKNNNKGSQTRYKMLKQIQAINADILCLQEFSSSSVKLDFYNNVIAVSKGLNYPYYYFAHNIDDYMFFNGSIIFSRFPIVDTGMVRYPRPTLPEMLAFADIKIEGKKMRIYTTHLQSNRFKKNDISKIKELKEIKGNVSANAKYIISKLGIAIKHRSVQADMINSIIKNSPNPVVFCGDMNDVPNSYTYKTVKSNMKDAFLQKGFGIGRTYTALSPTLRIDYIFTDNDFKIDQCKRVTTPYSDHYMVVADVQF